MERWIQESDDYRKTVHCLEDTFEVASLHWKKFCKCSFPCPCVVCKNHLSHGDDSVAAEEHVLSSAETDTFCTKHDCISCILWSICVGPDAHGLDLVNVVHELLVVLIEHGFGLSHCSFKNLHDFTWLYSNLLGIDVTCEAVNCHVVTFVKLLAVYNKSLLWLIDGNLATA